MPLQCRPCPSHVAYIRPACCLRTPPLPQVLLVLDGTTGLNMLNQVGWGACSLHTACGTACASLCAAGSRPPARRRTSCMPSWCWPGGVCSPSCQPIQAVFAHSLAGPPPPTVHPGKGVQRDGAAQRPHPDQAGRYRPRRRRGAWLECVRAGSSRVGWTAAGRVARSPQRWMWGGMRRGAAVGWVDARLQQGGCCRAAPAARPATALRPAADQQPCACSPPAPPAPPARRLPAGSLLVPPPPPPPRLVPVPALPLQVSVVDELGVPIKFIGVGEGIDDLQPFDAGGRPGGGLEGAVGEEEVGGCVGGAAAPRPEALLAPALMRLPGEPAGIPALMPSPGVPASLACGMQTPLWTRCSLKRRSSSPSCLAGTALSFLESCLPCMPGMQPRRPHDPAPPPAAPTSLPRHCASACSTLPLRTAPLTCNSTASPARSCRRQRAASRTKCRGKERAA